MLDSVNNAGIFLINTLFDLYLFILAIRLILVWTRVNYFNPLSQFIVKLTQPIIQPMRRIFPNLKYIELATVILMLALEVLKFFIIALISSGMPNILGLVVLGFADSIKTLLNVFFYAILLQAIMSWIQPGPSPMSQLLAQITAPIIRPFQRMLPSVGGFDISPIPALILLELLIILFVTPLLGLGLKMAIG